MSEDFYKNGVNIHVNDFDDVFVAGNYWGTKNHFGEYVAADGSAKYEISNGNDILNVATHENVGHIYQGNQVVTNNYSANDTHSTIKPSSGYTGSLIPFEVKVILFVLLAILGTIAPFIIIGLGILTTLIDEIGFWPVALISVSISAVVVLLTILVVKRIRKKKIDKRPVLTGDVLEEALGLVDNTEDITAAQEPSTLLPNGEKVIGVFSEEKPSNVKIFDKTNRLVYEGSFNGKYHGNGMMYQSDGSSLQGMWRSGVLIKGQGSYIHRLPNGLIVKDMGSFENGNLHGHGKRYVLSGDDAGGYWEAYFNNGAVHGQGVFYNKNGGWTKYTCVNGVLHGQAEAYSALGVLCWKTVFNNNKEVGPRQESSIWKKAQGKK